MRLTLLTVESSLPEWFRVASTEYETKISRFLLFEVKRLKSKNLARAEAAEKKKQESELILTKIKKDDFVILFDEKGKNLDTELFKKQLVQKVEGGIREIVFVAGGAFGASDELKKRANFIWKLSDLTMNHLVAQIVSMEQIYRALTIWKGIPYHNE